MVLFNEGVPTSLAIGQEPGHPQPWIIAMNDPPHRATVQDYACRWGIEPMFSDFKSRGFQLEDTQLQAADRLDRLLLIMTLAIDWCVRVGQEAARDPPTPLEKNSSANRSRALDLSKTRPQRPFLVHARFTGAGKATSDGTPLTPLLPDLLRHEKLIGGEGQNPTPRHNQYFIMKWDFSLVKAQGSLKEIETALY